MHGRSLLIALFALFACTWLPGVALAANPPHNSPAPANSIARAHEQPRASQHSENQDAIDYGEREMENPELEEFKGGDRVVISLGLGTLVVILILVILL